MKDKKFKEELRKLHFDEGVKIPVYWTLDDEGNVFVDFESMREEFEDCLNKISDLDGK